MADVTLRQSEQNIPFWRDTRKIAILLQVMFVILVVAVIAYLFNNMMEGLARSNLRISTAFLSQSAGIAIGEGPAYTSTDTWARAFYVGIANTLRVAVSGIILATLLGLVLGVSRLSNNWLLRNVAYVYTEIVRNTPLLLQLLFWFTLTSTFPRSADAINVGPFAALSNRGVFLAWPRQSETFGTWLIWLGAALLVGAGVYYWRRRELIRGDRPGAVLPWAFLASLLVAATGFVVTVLISEAPVYLDFPVLDRFNFQGGIALTAPFAALLTGLVVYTAAFIGEIVRAGIQSVSKGQREAAKALGLSDRQAMRLVILPQAMRVVVPPLTNQYLNLTKNSSLAIAIAYPDLFFVGATVINQTGQTVVVFAMIMATYLSFSLLTSLLMNWYNRRIQLVER
ncbi:MAG: ABC transporter permease subunit [Chloroflexota bacterium]|nr:ABC transporter permease subunit [Chloroflexota bacterium]